MFPQYQTQSRHCSGTICKKYVKRHFIRCPRCSKSSERTHWIFIYRSISNSLHT